MATSRGATAGNGILSSITSLFGSTSLGERGENGASSSASAGTRPSAPRKGSSLFGSGLRGGRAREQSNDDRLWSLPYSNSAARPPLDSPRSATALNGSTAKAAYDNSPMASPSPFGGLMGSPHLGGGAANESSSTLVPGQSRTSMSMPTKVAIPSTAYPPLKHTWRRIRAWCDQNYTELSDTLNWPATEAQIEDLELEIGYALPPAVRDSFLCYDGQELESHQSCSDGLFFGLQLMSLEQVAEEWRFWRGVDEDPTSGANAEVKGWMSSCPAGWVRHEYSCRGWIPLITDRVGNYVGVDLTPQPDGGGSPGQVILFGRDFDTKIVLWRGEGEGGWGRFLQSIAEEFESGQTFTLEAEVSSDSNDEEDAIGYESYYSGTGGGHGGGDRGGDGAASFKLRGEYKGWPVFEAWADRSMRSWEEMGMPVGQPAWRVDPPRVVLPEEGSYADDSYEDAREQFNEHGENLYAGSSRQHAQVSTNEASSSSASHPLDTSADSSSQSFDAEHTSRDTLSPPPMRSFVSKKNRQREEQWAHDQHQHHRQRMQAPQRPRKTAPAPAAPLDLPTIDDVRAAHAAAIASQQRAGNYHYDSERIRPPAGSGGMGMGMGMSSGALPSYVPRYSSKLSAPGTARRSGSSSAADGQPRLVLPEEDGLELENRASAEVMSPLRADLSSDEYSAATRPSSDVVVDMNNSSLPGASQWPTNGARTPTSGSRTLYSAGSATHSSSNLSASGSGAPAGNGNVGSNSTRVGTLIDDGAGRAQAGVKGGREMQQPIPDAQSGATAA